MATQKLTISLRNVISDAVALLFVLFVPAISHLTALPLYLLDPMRIAVLGVLLVTRDWKNTAALAVLLPLFSAMVSGHPVFPKCMIISVELAANVLLFEGFVRLLGRVLEGRLHLPGRRFAQPLAAGAAAFLSIALSKALYYFIKWLVLTLGWMQMEVVSTALWIQLVIAIAVSLLFALAASRRR